MERVSAVDMSEQALADRRKQVIDQFVALYGSRRIVEALALFHEDGVYHDSFYGPYRGRAELREMLEMASRDGKDYIWEINRIAAAPDRMMVEFGFSYTTSYGGFPPKRVRIGAVAVFVFDGALIREFSEYFDSGPALVQLGLGCAGVLRQLQRRRRAGTHAIAPRGLRADDAAARRAVP